MGPPAHRRVLRPPLVRPARGDILSSLVPPNLFLPSQVGLDDLLPSARQYDDVAWHALEELSDTDRNPTLGVPAAAMAHRFTRANWDHDSAATALGIPIGRSYGEDDLLDDVVLWSAMFDDA